MTTLLQEFEEWLKSVYNPNEDYALAIHHAKNKIEELKKKYKTEKWTMPEEAFRWLVIQHEYNALKEKYKIGQTTAST